MEVEKSLLASPYFLVNLVLHRHTTPPLTHSAVYFQRAMQTWNPETQHPCNEKSITFYKETAPVDLSPLYWFSSAMLLNQNIIFYFDLPYLTEKGIVGSTTARHTEGMIQSYDLSCVTWLQPQAWTPVCMTLQSTEGVFSMAWASAKITFQRNIYSTPSLAQKNKIQTNLQMSFTVFPYPWETRCWNKWMKSASCLRKATLIIYPFCWPSSRKFPQAKKTLLSILIPKPNSKAFY